MVTTSYAPDGTAAPTATRLPAVAIARYPRLSVRIEADGSITTMVRMDDCKKGEALAYARERVNTLLLVTAGWLSVDGEPVRSEVTPVEGGE
jgi:hypothetical protein